MNLQLAPLQGFTDAIFRQVWQRHFSGIDAYYAPYITCQNDGTIKKSQWRDILPENNAVLPVPQILPNSSEEALGLMAHIDTLAVYHEVNINMGCPYPMVTNRGRGSGLLPHPETIDMLLDQLFEQYGGDYDFSVKLRVGLLNAYEMESVFRVINRYPLKSIVLHPRIAKDLYKGRASWDDFAKAQTMTDKALIYNGDINTLDDYWLLSERFSTLEGVMLGRGVLMNPLLPQEIVAGAEVDMATRLPLYLAFIKDLIDENRQYLSGDSHLLSKMKAYLPYWESFNPNQRKVFKKLKKVKGVKSFVGLLSQYLVE